MFCYSNQKCTDIGSVSCERIDVNVDVEDPLVDVFLVEASAHRTRSGAFSHQRESASNVDEVAQRGFNSSLSSSSRGQHKTCENPSPAASFTNGFPETENAEEPLVPDFLETLLEDVDHAAEIRASILQDDLESCADLPISEALQQSLTSKGQRIDSHSAANMRRVCRVERYTAEFRGDTINEETVAVSEAQGDQDQTCVFSEADFAPLSNFLRSSSFDDAITANSMQDSAPSCRFPPSFFLDEADTSTSINSSYGSGAKKM